MCFLTCDYRHRYRGGARARQRVDAVLNPGGFHGIFISIVVEALYSCCMETRTATTISNPSRPAGGWKPSGRLVRQGRRAWWRATSPRRRHLAVQPVLPPQALAHAGLVSVGGRALPALPGQHPADAPDLIAYLTEECCSGQPENAPTCGPPRAARSRAAAHPADDETPTMNVLFLYRQFLPVDLARATFNHLAPAGWRALSAGSKPTAGYVHPQSLALLAREGIAIRWLSQQIVGRAARDAGRGGHGVCQRRRRDLPGLFGPVLPTGKVETRPTPPAPTPRSTRPLAPPTASCAPASKLLSGAAAGNPPARPRRAEGRFPIASASFCRKTIFQHY